MLIAAARDHRLDLSRSWMIGDRYVDIAAARAAGARAILIRTGHDGSDRGKYDCAPDYIAENLADAVSYSLRALL
jgi:D-glycero-D-manno-heptose 1,7-bisphosphate phosphatase